MIKILKQEVLVRILIGKKKYKIIYFIFIIFFTVKNYGTFTLFFKIIVFKIT